MQTNLQNREKTEVLSSTIIALRSLMVGFLVLLVVIPLAIFFGADILQAAREEIANRFGPVIIEASVAQEKFWSAPQLSDALSFTERSRIEYGRELIVHTSKYLGPKGSVAQISNGLNCQNCHLDAGTRTFGNNYSAVASTYPKFRARSGATEDVYKRVNDCFQRSLNGQPLDTLSREMQAIKAYMEFLGTDVDKGEKPNGVGLKNLAFLDRAADPNSGKAVYEAKCASCHQLDGGGQLMADGTEYTYPPLWGRHSYNDGAGLYRLSNFAKYAMYNMPLGVNHNSPMLTAEEAWDVAAYVNSQPRPHLDTPADWPDVSKKPFDHPFGPYADPFSETQHKFGPFTPITDYTSTTSSSSTTLR